MPSRFARDGAQRVGQVADTTGSKTLPRGGDNDQGYTVFKSDNSPSVSNSDENQELLRNAAAQVSPVNELNRENQHALCRAGSVLVVQRNDQIQPEQASRWLVYLVEGTLTLYQGKEEVGQISARSPDAQKPLFMNKTEYTMAKTTSVAKIVKFGREQVTLLLNEQQKAAIQVVDAEVGELDNLVFDDIRQLISSNNVHLASHSESARRILGSFQNVAGIPELVEIILADPGLCAHLVYNANNADGGGDPTHSVRGAITRLGVDTTKRYIGELMKANTIVPANDVIAHRLRRYVQRTTLSSAIVQVLCKMLGNDLKSEVAALAAQVADIGELLILAAANKHADQFDDDAKLLAVIENLRTIVTGWLLSVWDYPQDLIDVSQTARKWYRNHTGELGYADLVTAALLIINAELPESDTTSIPAADNLLLARRLQQAGIDIRNPGEITAAASERVVNTQQLLKKAS